MIVLPLLLLAMAPQDKPDLNKEGACVFNEMHLDAEREQDKVPPEMAQRICQFQYKWTDRETEVALHIAIAEMGFYNKMLDAKAKGMDEDMLNAIYASFTRDQMAQFGWTGETKPPPVEVDKLILARLQEKGVKDHDGLMMGVEVIMSHALVDNAAAVFFDLRGKD